MLTSRKRSRRRILVLAENNGKQNAPPHFIPPDNEPRRPSRPPRWWLWVVVIVIMGTGAATGTLAFRTRTDQLSISTLPSTKQVGEDTVPLQTEETVRSHKLNVPYYTQQYRASCTGAALRMILDYRGIDAHDKAIVERMGYKPTRLDTSQTPHRWDDPSEMFVGDINGSIAAGTAAGPDAPPVAKAARSYGRDASVVYHPSMTMIARSIYAGNPVIEFGAASTTSAISWKTPSGRITVMNLTSHVRVVTGVYGDPDQPIGFWVSDPLGGGSQYWSADALADDMSRDPYGQAVIVR